MEVIYECCGGIDVHKKLIVVCLRSGRKNEIRQFGSTTKELREMTAWLKEAGCQMVAMESTGSYWKPLYNIFELSDLDAIVVNAQHMRNLPGRKTDIKDAEWIADLLQHGLLKSSYIPDRDQRELRDITRYRKSLVGEKSREINRLQKFLEGSNIKLSSYVTNINGVSSLALLKLSLSGKTIDRETVIQTVDPKLKSKADDIVLSLEGVFSSLQKALVLQIISHIEDMEKRVKELDDLINRHLGKFEKAIQKADQLPGIAENSAKTIIAEIGIDMSRFPTDAHLASWAGLSPGNNESAGKKKNSKCIKGNPTLKSTLIQCAVVACAQKGTFFHAQYQRIALRRGKNRAHVAVAHSMLIALYHMIKENIDYVDLGDNYYNQFNREAKINHLLKRLNALGWQEPAALPV